MSDSQSENTVPENPGTRGLHRGATAGESIWSLSAEELLARTASDDATPGGGSIAAVSGALGLGLVLMAAAITGEPVADREAQGRALLARIRAAADRDVAEFGALMEAYGLPRDDADARAAAIETASVTATRGPLDLAADVVEALELAQGLEPLVKRMIVSDVLAGRDLLVAAGRAAIRTADSNLAVLERSGSEDAAALRARRDELAARIEGAA